MEYVSETCGRIRVGDRVRVSRPIGPLPIRFSGEGRVELFYRVYRDERGVRFRPALSPSHVGGIVTYMENDTPKYPAWLWMKSEVPFELTDNHKMWRIDYVIEVLEASKETMIFDLRRYYAAMGKSMPELSDEDAIRLAWEDIPKC